jgi:hypothetical protein
LDIWTPKCQIINTGMEDVDPECVIKLASHMSRLRTNKLEFHIYPRKLCKADALKMSRERERESEREFTTDLKICTLTASNLFT